MNRAFLSTIVLGLAAPASLLAQSPAVCAEEGTVASVMVHSGATIDGLTLWRGTSPADGRTPEWREIVCVSDEGAAEATPADVPENWGLPDLTTIESLLLASEELGELRVVEAGMAADAARPLAGRVSGEETDSGRVKGVRAIVMDPDRPDAPLHVLVETATATLVRVVVESKAGSLGLAWTRSPEDPIWRAVAASS